MIDKDKKYMTRDGREARIYATDGRAHRPIQGAVLQPTCGWEMYEWEADGRYFSTYGEPSPADLIEVKPRIKETVWINIFSTYTMCHPSKEIADYYYSNNCTKNHPPRLACVQVEIDCPHGEGIDL